MVFIVRPSKCDWYPKIKTVYSLCQRYLDLFNDIPPIVSKCNCRNGQTRFSSQTTVRTHANNIFDIIKYKSQGNNQVFLQLRSYMGKQWKNDLLREWNLSKQLSGPECHNLQSHFKMTDHPFFGLTARVNNLVGWRVFASQTTQKQLRKNANSNTGQVSTVKLKTESTNKYEHRQVKEFDIWYSHENEIINALLDKQINNNDFIMMKQLNNEYWFQHGGDKGTKSGLASSCTVIGPKLSATESLPCMYVPDTAVAESGSNLAKCYQNMDYDKHQLWKSMSARPGIVNLVLFHVNLKKSMDSRLSRSCLVCINPIHQSMVNQISVDDTDIDIEIDNKNDDEKNDEHSKICNNEFVTECKLNRSAKKAEHKSWRNALKELKEWEKEYDRPSGVGCMSNIERKGGFKQASMCVYSISDICYS